MKPSEILLRAAELISSPALGETYSCSAVSLAQWGDVFGSHNYHRDAAWFSGMREWYGRMFANDKPYLMVDDVEEGRTIEEARDFRILLLTTAAAVAETELDDTEEGKRWL